MTDLRRLAEEALATEDDPEVTFPAQAILALLNERDHDRALIGTLAEDQALAERRVAALEEGLRALIAQWDAENLHGMAVAADKARALLAAAPSEPLRLGQQVAVEGHLPRDIQERVIAAKDGMLLFKCPDCGTMFDAPAALTSASAESEGLPAEVGE